MAEYSVGMVISLERGFLDYQGQQERRLWLKIPYRPLDQLTLGILGATGDIGAHIAKAAKGLGMRVVGFGRSHRDEVFPFLDAVHFGSGALPAMLSEVDYLVSCLPSTKETVGLLSGDILSHCTRSPGFMNIGRFGRQSLQTPISLHSLTTFPPPPPPSPSSRFFCLCARGDIIDEESVIRALDNKWIKVAVLDVMTKEPLPESSRLWTHRSVKAPPLLFIFGDSNGAHPSFL